jgi:hypothetical protein
VIPAIFPLPNSSTTFLSGSSIDPIIIPNLPNQHPIRQAEIHRDRNHRRHEPRPRRPSEIAAVAQEPDKEEREGDGGGGGVAEVLEELRDLDIEQQGVSITKERGEGFLVEAGRGLLGRTRRKIQQAMEMEPRIPERASWKVRGIAAAGERAMTGFWGDCYVRRCGYERDMGMVITQGPLLAGLGIRGPHDALNAWSSSRYLGFVADDCGVKKAIL